MVQHQQRRTDAVKVAHMLSGGQRTATLQHNVARAEPSSVWENDETLSKTFAAPRERGWFQPGAALGQSLRGVDATPRSADRRERLRMSFWY